MSEAKGRVIKTELVQIRYFITVAQYQNISKAAKILNITQPALSKSISKLEDELGVRLFDRYGKRVTLNDRGEMFLELAVGSMQKLEEAVACVRHQLPSNPILHIGLFHNSESFLQCFVEFSAANPNINFQLEHLDISSNAIDTNEYDMILYPQNPAFRSYRGFMIYSDRYLLAVNKANHLARETAIHINKLPAHKMIFIRHSSIHFDLPYHFCAVRGIRVSDGIYTNNYEIQRWLISNNCGIGFIPQSSASSYISDPEIRLLDVIDDGLNQEVMIGFKREKHLSEAGKEFAAFTRSYFGITQERRKSHETY